MDFPFFVKHVTNTGQCLSYLCSSRCRHCVLKIKQRQQTIVRCEQNYQDQRSPNSINLSRRQVVGVSSSAAALLAWVETEAKASKLGVAVDNAWEKVGGGPPDLFFPQTFEGVWDVESVLVDTKTPLGEEYVPDIRALTRARNEDLNKVLQYRIAFRRNDQGKVIMDRVYNTAKLVEAYLGDEYNISERIQWNPNDPNILTLSLPGGLIVNTRVTRRSFNQPADDLIETSEYFEQVFDNPNGDLSKVKGSQCFTKYRWRDEEVAKKDEGPMIVATQVVSDYLTAFDDQVKLLEARGRPVVVFVYKMAFRRADNSVGEFLSQTAGEDSQLQPEMVGV
eukprot:TRINITY_DN1940_c0_g1_i5.p1 TRINITY_DN1940_c0_g1~~TRINITY_DN1940_c0_g1_i5.p1  ORF type:complete len:351 (-),score=47.98 TRINITY_DN1940_c0_g1_i5:238-1245(-)